MLRLTLMTIALIAASVIFNQSHAQSSGASDYDHLFRKYSKRYFGAHFDWHWFKAQAIAESNLNPEAKSRVGAVGIMQIMPATYSDIKRSNPHFGELESPRWNVAAGIYYNRMLFRKWQQTLSERERLLLTFASYNAGLGSIKKAFRKTPPPVTRWDDIAPKAPSETRGYVRKIRKLRKAETFNSVPATKGIAGKMQRASESNNS